MEFIDFSILAAIFLVAILYSSVGHGGGSGYLALMALFGVSPLITKPTALALNIFVASIASFQFYRRGYFSWRIFLGFAAASIPFAFIGGMINLPISYYKILLGAALIAASLRLAWEFSATDKIREFNIFAAMLIGAVIGFTSGLIGIGGGIFLTPILLLVRWTSVKQAAGISAFFIVVNSAAALIGNYETARMLPSRVGIWVIVAATGGIIGSTLGSRYFDSPVLRRLLALVLVIAGVKLLFV